MTTTGTAPGAADGLLDEAVRAQQRAAWALAAPGWAEYRRDLAAPARRVDERMFRLARLGPGDRVLDLACGAGGPALAAAERVGRGGRVLGLDLAPPMVAAARSLARERGAVQAEFRTVAAENELGVPPGSFDAAVCRAGLPYMPDRAGALRAVRAALRPGGRFSALLADEPGVVSPFRVRHGVVTRRGPAAGTGRRRARHGGLGEWTALLESAGFTGVRAEARRAPVFEAEHAAAAWVLIVRTSGALLSWYSGLDERSRDAVHREAVRTLAAWFPDGPVRPSGEVVLLCGTNPG
ncbi:class I SAM-dependent methyltransferase [Actinomadura oligospora]|uniref:class I SAM-dependent methyltransferase n=1 Tax=Actinomadura oligospora TaxID=111804 RepID=UPI0004AC6A3C|nr:class I SAM-dependent methyltransferase [Actinomadura oligospora]